MLMFVPETQRKIVGDGSASARGVYRSFFPIFQTTSGRSNKAGFKRPNHQFPNPFTSIKVLESSLEETLGSLFHS